MSIAVYCKCCHSLLGYYEKGVKEANRIHRGRCPFCRKATHQDQDEKKRNYDGLLAFIDKEPDKSSLIEGPAPDSKGQIPEHLKVHRKRFMAHMTLFEAVPPEEEDEPNEEVDDGSDPSA